MSKILAMLFSFLLTSSVFAQQSAIYESQNMLTGEITYEEHKKQGNTVVSINRTTKEVIDVTTCTEDETFCTIKSKYADVTMKVPFDVVSLPPGSVINGILTIKPIKERVVLVHTVTIGSVMFNGKKIIGMRSTDGTIESTVLMSNTRKMPSWAENKIFSPEGDLLEHEIIRRIDVEI